MPSRVWSVFKSPGKIGLNNIKIVLNWLSLAALCFLRTALPKCIR